MMKLNHLYTLLMVLVVIVSSFQATAIAPEKREVQWAYIMNFIHYITWPSARADSQINVCIVGKSPFAVADEEARSVNKKTGSVTVTKQYPNMPELSELKVCQVIYFSQNISLAQLSFIFSKLESLPIVTIGDHRAFLRIGGMLQFTEKNKKLRFSLNKELLNSMDLKIHPSLMRLSD
jgi:hypothetical protein